MVGLFITELSIYGCDDCWKDLKKKANIQQIWKLEPSKRIEVVNEWHNKTINRIRKEKLEAI
jgi:hypothetical protein